MEALILNSQYQTLSVLDTFESFIWTDRYRGYGDFEVYLPVAAASPDLLTRGNYLKTKNSDRLMIIEDIAIDTDTENGDYATITGRSLESILERRIIWGQSVITGNLQSGIQSLLTANAISPSNSARTIPGLTFRASSVAGITALSVETQFFGDNLYEAICALCEVYDLGFRMLPSGTGGFFFELYMGADRSYDQTVNPWIVFSPTFENILSSNYFESARDYKNAALSAGEGEGSARILAEATIGSGVSGLNRRELYVDSGSISQTVDQVEMTVEAYTAQLAAKGTEALSETKVTESFEGEIDATRQYIYGRDFFIGDIVQIVNEYGMTAKSRVSEVVQSSDENGETMLPTFSTVV